MTDEVGCLCGFTVDKATGSVLHADYCASPQAYAERTGADLTFCAREGHETVRGEDDTGPCAQCGSRIAGRPAKRVLTAKTLTGLECLSCGHDRPGRDAGCVRCRLSLLEVRALNGSVFDRHFGVVRDHDRFR